jgi:hypothetical protein
MSSYPLYRKAVLHRGYTSKYRRDETEYVYLHDRRFQIWCTRRRRAGHLDSDIIEDVANTCGLLLKMTDVLCEWYLPVSMPIKVPSELPPRARRIPWNDFRSELSIHVIGIPRSTEASFFFRTFTLTGMFVMRSCTSVRM